MDGYGLGVVRFTRELFNDIEIWGHSGHAPEYEVSIRIMTNTEKGEAMHTINDLLSIIARNLEMKH